MKYPTKEEILEKFYYFDGALFRREATPNKRIKALTPSGSICTGGHLQTNYKGAMLMNHRLIWILHYGECPEYLDHIDNNKTNNRIENLRPASKSNNNWNIGKYKNNKSGVKGVFFNKRKNKWIAAIRTFGVRKYLGIFSEIEDAKQAVMQARNLAHKEFANHG